MQGPFWDSDPASELLEGSSFHQPREGVGEREKGWSREHMWVNGTDVRQHPQTARKANPHRGEM